MPHRFELIPMPASREPATLLAVDRVVSEIRRGRIVAIRGAGGTAVLTLAAEGATPERLSELETISKSKSSLMITARRATVLNLIQAAINPVCLSIEGTLTADTVRDIADPLAEASLDALHISAKEAEPFSCNCASVGLTKIARLLPVTVVAPLEDSDTDGLAAWAARHDILLVDAGDVFQYEHAAARRLIVVSEASVPLLDAQDSRITAFRPVDGGLEHIAIIIGDPDKKAGDKDDPDNGEPVLARIHSECFTGDLLGSLRCDCGDQLRGAIQEIASAGSGVLLYLAQEGRGIGLVNKLRAYTLQDRGFDTLDANEQLGFDADERVYLPAAQMLRQLGFTKVRLMTNNPDKVEAMMRCGVQVTERVAHSFPSNEHNEAYLNTKAARLGHQY